MHALQSQTNTSSTAPGPPKRTMSPKPAGSAQITSSTAYHKHFHNAPSSQIHTQHLHLQAPNHPSHTTRHAAPTRHHPRAPRNAVDLLPFCTISAPLTNAQVIALSDVVGSLKELAVLALRAASGDQQCMGRLMDAVGEQAAVGIVEFFVEEWEIDG
jgi:hypothetical protein